MTEKLVHETGLKLGFNEVGQYGLGIGASRNGLQQKYHSELNAKTLSCHGQLSNAIVVTEQCEQYMDTQFIDHVLQNKQIPSLVYFTLYIVSSSLIVNIYIIQSCLYFYFISI